MADPNEFNRYLLDSAESGDGEPNGGGGGGNGGGGGGNGGGPPGTELLTVADIINAARAGQITWPKAHGLISDWYMREALLSREVADQKASHYIGVVRTPDTGLDEPIPTFIPGTDEFNALYNAGSYGPVDVLSGTNQPPPKWQGQQTWPLDRRPEGGLPRADAFLGAEVDPLQVFNQFLSQQPALGDLSARGRSAIEGQFQPAYQSWLAQVTDPTSTFRDFLSGGGQILGPEAMQQRLGEIASAFGIPRAQRTDPQRFLTGPSQFGSNVNALNAFLQPLLARTNPLFRRGVEDVAQNVFDRFQATTPELALFPALHRRGGFFGNA